MNVGPTPITPPTQRRDESDTAFYDDFAIAVGRVIYPVIITMLLSIYLVHSIQDQNCFPQDPQNFSVPPPTFTIGGGDNGGGGGDSGAGSSNTEKLTAIIFLSSFLGSMVLFTFILVLLYKYHCTKFIVFWLLLSVVMIFGYVGGTYLFTWVRGVCFPLDWFTYAYFVYNFAIVGVVAVFWKAPRILNQFYLIVMSSLIAYVFRALPEWATWLALGILVLWDLFAVLAPCGPLRLLVESARERGDPLPALVYDTNPASVGRDPSAQAAAALSVGPAAAVGGGLGEGTWSERNTRAQHSSSTGALEEKRQDDSEVVESEAVKRGKSAGSAASRRKSPYIDPSNPTSASASAGALTVASGGGASATGAAAHAGIEDPAFAHAKLKKQIRPPQNPPISQPSSSTLPNMNPAGTGPGDGPASYQPQSRKRDVGSMGKHLKLGLGDFVFYSVLVAQSSRFGMMTTVTSFIAIITGLCVTLFLVVMLRIALPALPVSITLGIIAYFVTQYTMQPFVENLFPYMMFH